MKEWFLVRDYPEKLEQLITHLLPLLYSDGEVQNFFSAPSMVSYRSARKIKDYIVSSKLYPLDRNVGCGGCGNGRYQVCKNIKLTDTFDSPTANKVTKSVMNLIAMISA